jgi:hypothetical protein
MVTRCLFTPYPPRAEGARHLSPALQGKGAVHEAGHVPNTLIIGTAGGTWALTRTAGEGGRAKRGGRG